MPSPPRPRQMCMAAPRRRALEPVDHGPEQHVEQRDARRHGESCSPKPCSPPSPRSPRSPSGRRAATAHRRSHAAAAATRWRPSGTNLRHLLSAAVRRRRRREELEGGSAEGRSAVAAGTAPAASIPRARVSALPRRGPAGVSPPARIGGTRRRRRRTRWPHRAQTEGCLPRRTVVCFRSPPFGVLAPRAGGRLGSSRARVRRRASHTGHTHVCMVVSFRRYTSAPSRVSHENGSSGAARSAAHRKLSWASTQRSAGSSSAASSPRPRRAGRGGARRHRSAFMPRYARAGSGSASGSRGAAVREEGGGRRKHSVRSFARGRGVGEPAAARTTRSRVSAPPPIERDAREGAW